MPRTLPPLSTLRAFEAAARLGSVSRAADELGRTHGAVSRQLRALQDHAGVALFERAGTGVRLTEEGAAFRTVVSEALAALERGYRRLLDDVRGPSLHVACSATFAMRWLVPRLAEFYRRHPDVHVRLSMTSAGEFRPDGADLLLTWDPPPGGRERMDVVRLADVAFGPVCAPDYLTAVRGEALVFQTRVARERASRAWERWQGASELQARWSSELTFPHTHLCIEAAITGLGVALIDPRLIREELARGRLVAPCGFANFEDGLMAFATSDRASSKPARAFLDWLAETLLAEEG
ncbi:MAG TPA: LysR substrate-binding domain-containing protein [Caulobacteraceae bacterium]|jgi:DNA-binding transcriptional LysR family regulator|nr:LysR substrate-binding domain-containing protein [Caulobacteraceae bacterium]